MLSYLAVDAGGTSTRAVLLEPDGRCVGYGRAGGGNPISAGPDRAATQITAATQAALAQAQASPDAVPAAVLAMAGSRAYLSTEWISAPMAALGLAHGVVLLSDLLATFCSAGPELDGYAIVSGTGTAAIRSQGGRVVGTSDGLGWLLGDTGSGFWIGRRVVRSAAADLDGRAPATAMTALVLRDLGIPNTPDRHDEGRLESLRALTDRIYAMRPIELARFAPVAFEAEGDHAARAILQEAAQAAAATIQSLLVPEVAGPVVLGGTVLGRLPGVSEFVAQSQRAIGQSVDVRRVADGAVGAAVLALRHGGVEVTREVYDRIVATLAGLR